MSVDIVKQLDRAKRLVEKRSIDEAIEAYQTVLADFPNHLESMQSLGDLYTMQNRPDRAAVYYGMLFDRFIAPREEPKALALYTRFLKSQQQPPQRVARYALLLQKQNRAEEALEQFMSAALAFELSDKGEDALACFVRIAQLDSENRDRHVTVANLAERIGNLMAAARGYLRAGQLTTDNNEEALEFFAKAHVLIPEDRSGALYYAQALLRKGDAEAAATILEPLSKTERDATYLDTYADALIRSSQLDTARTLLESMQSQGIGSAEKFFLLTTEFLKAGQEEKAVELLVATKKSMIAARNESEFAAAADKLVEAFPKSTQLAKFWADLYSELNRETKFFEAEVHLFDLHFENNEIHEACEAFEKLVEIDPYDSRNQQRYDLLNGRAEVDFLKRVRSRLSNAATHNTETPSTQQPRKDSDAPSPALLEAVQSRQSLEDLLVQAEIFIQYSLQSKAVERLQRIAELFPGEDENNERLQSLYDAARWWPEKSAIPAIPAEMPQASIDAPIIRNATSPYAPETLRDLSKISEINQNVFRQPSPRAMLSVAVNEVGNYLRVTRCIGAIGPPGQPPQMASEFCSTGIQPSSSNQIVRLMSQLSAATPDSLGGLSFEASSAPILAEMGLETALGVHLTDPETQSPAGMIILGFVGPHAWKPNESYFLQSVGDQMLMCVHHTRLRTLVRTLAVADEKTGLLARSSYIDCLLHESQRARTQGLPLALALLQVDGGPELLRQQGEGPFDRYMEQLGESVNAIVRQTDLAIKYTSWALAIVLPDTPLSGAQKFAEKLKAAVSGLRPSWDAEKLTMSVAIAEAIASKDYDNEDIVTDLINRVESGLEEARKRGGNEIIALELAKN
ncbi:MAG TPA: diguanylate cyclase [Candidatus Saccharimonadales bacterium]|jgi:diguanylate cyclase (GGDEF)-like protein|nr:diguanylate cyclase [Candidatus Saccharimonadales bacterium]